MGAPSPQALAALAQVLEYAEPAARASVQRVVDESATSQQLAEGLEGLAALWLSLGLALQDHAARLRMGQLV